MQRPVGDWLSFALMADFDSNTVITAIRNADFEGFVAGTLFSQGWNVTYRALDIQSLITYLDSATEKRSLLLISTDLDGLTPGNLLAISQKGFKYFLFASSDQNIEIYPESLAQPTTPLELMGLIRGSLRAPLVRKPHSQKVRARTIAISSPSHSSGCTTLTINLGAELAQVGKKVLIVDANPYFPAFAVRLGERGIKSSTELRNLWQGLYAFEVSQHDVSAAIEALERARSEFDFILIDQGAIRDFPAILHGRRWCGEIFIWISNYADELWLLSKTDHLSLERLRALLSEFSKNAIKPELSVAQWQTQLGKQAKVESASFLQLVTAARPARILNYPWDPRGVSSAENEQSTLADISERGALRKSIAHIAGELIS